MIVFHLGSEIGPGAGMGFAVVIAVVAQQCDFERKRTVKRTLEIPGKAQGAAAGDEPDSLFNEDIADFETPYRRAAFEQKTPGKPALASRGFSHSGRGPDADQQRPPSAVRHPPSAHEPTCTSPTRGDSDTRKASLDPHPSPEYSS